jgi:secreted PhoX family phosphatase
MNRSAIIGAGLACAAALVVVAFAQTSGFQPFPKGNAFEAFINTQTFASEKGATAEWRKMGGVAYQPKTRALYYAITAFGKGMSDGKGDIQFKENKCGAIMMGSLDEKMNLSGLSTIIAGGPFDEKNKAYPCNANAISNPDNIFADSKGNLWIGEDTDYHQNQFLWLWNGKELKRFATMPLGAEVTGLRVLENGTVFLNIQHPSGTNTYPFNRGTVGVITGFKAGDDFKSVPVPTGDNTKRLTLAAGQYQVLGRAGDQIPGGDAKFGQLNRANGEMMDVCNNPDGNMFLPTSSSNTEGYLYTNFECAPGAMSKIYIRRAANGTWQSIEGESVDFSGVGGTWSNCAASVTPWNTGLSGEEYPADVAGEWADWEASIPRMEAHLGYKPNQYNIGYALEINPGGGEDGGIFSGVTKRYAMGRQSWELGLVMPDGKTVYSGNDGTDRVMLKFVADKAEDLSAGTLYAAKVKQDGEKLGITWIELGKGKDEDIAKAIVALDKK